mmetsp:Transcript_83372/g.147670  ORF Transcript_83372/g.147670 Transcript_83372/m.147670 type:complete len:100 (-) Transcript_83372:2524-2823(-)
MTSRVLVEEPVLLVAEMAAAFVTLDSQALAASRRNQHPEKTVEVDLARRSAVDMELATEGSVGANPAGGPRGVISEKRVLLTAGGLSGLSGLSAANRVA